MRKECSVARGAGGVNCAGASLTLARAGLFGGTLRRAVDTKVLTCQIAGAGQSVVNARRECIQIIVRRATDYARVGGILLMQLLEMPAIVGQHRPASSSRIRENLSVAATRTAQFGDGDDVMAPQP